MGSLAYDGLTIRFEDRILAHLQIVIVQKLRRQESFLMSWRDSDSVGDGRSSIWLDPSIPLYFKFDGGHAPEVNRAWLEVLVLSAQSPHGLIVTSEHASTGHEDAHPATDHRPSGREARTTTADPSKLDRH